MKKFILISLLLIAAPAPALQGGSSQEARRESFEIVWRTVREKHFDPTLGGLDWDEVRKRYAPRLETIKSDRELYALLQQMLSELHQSHFSIIPPEAVIETDPSDTSKGGIGVDLRILDGQAVITEVKPESAAYRAGLRRGFVILEIDQTRAEALISRASRADQSQAMIRLLATRALTSRLEGKTDSTVRLVYLDANDRRRETVVRREPPGGEVSEAFGNFPAQRTFFEARRLEGGAGYVRFNIFVMSLMEKIRSAIRSMKDAPGIIIDLRGNPGGIGAMAGGIASEMESRQLSLGTMKMRAGHVNFAVFPQKNPFAGKVAILIDGGSASTSEIFAAGMQELGRAVVIGERSAGAALPSIITKLPTGALFQFAIGDFRTPKGTLIEGRGVVPDVEVRLSRRELLRGRDSQLDAALKAIQKSASGKPIRQTSSARPNTGKIIRGKS